MRTLSSKEESEASPFVRVVTTARISQPSIILAAIASLDYD
jgi:hypothetical protein